MNNTVKVIIKVATALAAVAGIVYVIAAYGDKIVAWAKRVLGCDPCADCDADCETCECDCEYDDECFEEAAEEVVEEAAEEPAAEEEAVVASEADFEG